MGGDSPAPSTQESTAAILQALQQNLPGVMSAISGTVLPTEQSNLAATQAVSPGYAALQNQLFSQYAPQLADTGNQIARANQLAQSNTDVATLEGPGQQLVQKALETARATDPEYYASRGNAATALNSLLAPNLSGGERAEIERAVNQKQEQAGNLATPTATGTVEAAQTFGSALRDRLGQALSLSSQVLPALKSGIDPLQVALNRPSQPNVGVNQFSGVGQPNVGANSFQTGNNFLQGITSLRQQQVDVNANRRDSLDRVTGVLGSLPNIS